MRRVEASLWAYINQEDREFWRIFGCRKTHSTYGTGQCRRRLEENYHRQSDSVCYFVMLFLPAWDCPDGQRSTVNVRQAIQTCTITLAICSTKVSESSYNPFAQQNWGVLNPPQRAHSRLLNLISLLLETETVHDFWLICFSTGQNLHRSMESLHFEGLFRALFFLSQNNRSGSFYSITEPTAISWMGIYKQPRPLLNVS